MHEGDTVEILSADYGPLIGKQGIIVAVNPVTLTPTGPDNYYVVEIGGVSTPSYWTAPYLKLVETYEQATARELGDEYFK